MESKSNYEAAVSPDLEKAAQLCPTESADPLKEAKVVTDETQRFPGSYEIKIIVWKAKIQSLFDA